MAHLHTENATKQPIAAVIAAAGRSQRMGTPKQLLPWGEQTVIAAVVETLCRAGAAPVLCVTGHLHQQIATVLTATKAQVLYNPDYLTGEMLSSYQAGIRQLEAIEQAKTDEGKSVAIGALLALGDQPHIETATVQMVMAQAWETPQQLVIPSFNHRRGHPMFLPRCLWQELLALSDTETMRTLVTRHAADICYVTVETPAVLRDMDTPADYKALRTEHQAIDH